MRRKSIQWKASLRQDVCKPLWNTLEAELIHRPSMGHVVWGLHRWRSCWCTPGFSSNMPGVDGYIVIQCCYVLFDLFAPRAGHHRVDPLSTSNVASSIQQRHGRRRWFESQHLTMKDWQPQRGESLSVHESITTAAASLTDFFKFWNRFLAFEQRMWTLSRWLWEGLCAGLAWISALTIRVLWMFEIV